MEQEFLYRVATQLIRTYGTALGEIKIILPNRRAMLFLQKHIAQQFEEPIWSPQLFTTDDLIKNHCEWVEADRLTLIDRLRKIREQVTEKSESLESFYFWGNQLIADFDEADKHLALTDQLFAYIRDITEIDEIYGELEQELKERLMRLWFLNDKPNHAFGVTWKNLGFIYETFKESLATDGLAYKGMMARYVAEHPETLSDLIDAPIAIIGFNRLDKSQKSIFRYLQHHTETKFFWQDHPEILNDRMASRFIRENQKQFPNALEKSDNHPMPEQIEIVPASGRSNQTQVIAHYIRNNEYKEEEIACILPDEGILQPLLRTMPERIKTINVTLGISLKETQAYTLIDAFFDLHRTAKRSFGHFRRSDVERIIRHPYLAVYFKPEGTDEAHFLDQDGAPLNFIGLEQLHLEKHLDGLIFQPLEDDVDLLLMRLISITTECYELVNSNDANEFHLEVLMRSHGQLKRLFDTLKNNEIEFSAEGLFQVIRNVFRMTRVPFRGEPLRGMQIMGPLEAQNLSFKWVAIASLNEGLFPSGHQESFIPMILRRVFGLPLQEDNAAEYAYYFWSSILPAKEVLLCYDTEQSGVGAKEASRFIQQLKMSQKKWPIKMKSIEQSALSFQHVEVEVNKSKETMILLSEKAQKGFAPTNINDYATCSLKFYLKHIAGVKEPKLSKTANEPHIVGLVLHDALQDLYTPFKSNGANFSTANGADMKAQIPILVDKHLRKELNLPDELITQGYAFLVRGIIIQYIEKVIDWDLAHPDFTICGLEDKEAQTTFKISTGQSVLIKGSIDRWDKTTAGYRVVDYKTGGFKLGASGSMKRTEVDSMEALFGKDTSKKQPKEALQSLIYAWMLGRMPDLTDQKIDAELYFVRAMGDEKYNPKVISKESKKSIVADIGFKDKFEPMLIGLLEEILDPEQTFKMTEDTDVCRFCEYRTHCQRE